MAARERSSAVGSHNTVPSLTGPAWWRYVISPSTLAVRLRADHQPTNPSAPRPPPILKPCAVWRQRGRAHRPRAPRLRLAALRTSARAATILPGVGGRGTIKVKAEAADGTREGRKEVSVHVVAERG